LCIVIKGSDIKRKGESQLSTLRRFMLDIPFNNDIERVLKRDFTSTLPDYISFLFISDASMQDLRTLLLAPRYLSITFFINFHYPQQTNEPNEPTSVCTCGGLKCA
jgi:hypothetical protein